MAKLSNLVVKSFSSRNEEELIFLLKEIRFKRRVVNIQKEKVSKEKKGAAEKLLAKMTKEDIIKFMKLIGEV